MGWFEDQIRDRVRKDEASVQDAFTEISTAVLGERIADRLAEDSTRTREAIDEILRYYRLPSSTPREGVQTMEELVDDALKPHGIMSREVVLEGKWYRDGYGPLLGFRKGSGAPVALLPRGLLGSYWFRDPETNLVLKVNRKTAQLLETDALCFYTPLPASKLGFRDITHKIRKSFTWGDLALVALATLAVTLVGFIGPRLYAGITGPVLEMKNLSLLNGAAVFLLTTAVVSQVLTAVRQMLMARLCTKATLAVESSVMMRILTMPVSFFRKYSAGELTRRAGVLTTLCEILLSSGLSVSLTSVVSLLYLTQIYSYAPSLLWPAVLVVAATLILSAMTLAVQIRITRNRLKISAEETGLSYALLCGIQKIRQSGAENRAFARWAHVYAREANLEYNPPMLLKLNGVIMTGIALAGNILIYALAVKNQVDPSSYYAFSAAYGRLTGAFTVLAGIAGSLAAIGPVMETAEPILQTEPEPMKGKVQVTRLKGQIEINHLFFRYETDQAFVLNDLSLKIDKGEYVALVGRTGSGKSSLIRLLLGFEKPEKGSIFYDGRDQGSLEMTSLRRRIGVVMQNGKLFQGNIFDNISIAAPQMTMEEAWAAAEAAGIADEIREMPMGMHTLISENQGGISGGQKQRLLIARALAGKPDILILDEATSALDNQTQKEVAEILSKMKCTRIVIAHRLSTIRNCDRIMVLDQGNIVEEGSYEELMAREGFFAKLVARQQLE